MNSGLKIFKLLAVSVTAFFVLQANPAAASTGRWIGLKAYQAYENAQAQATLQGNYHDEEKVLKIKFSGLVPGTVYSVWFENEKPWKDISGIGEVPYEAIVADDTGHAEFSSRVKENDLDKWQFIKVFRHKDGNAQNMQPQNLSDAFKKDVYTIKLLSFKPVPEGNAPQKQIDIGWKQ